MGTPESFNLTPQAIPGLLSSVQSGVYKIGGEQLGQIARVMDSALLSMKLREDAGRRENPRLNALRLCTKLC